MPDPEEETPEEEAPAPPKKFKQRVFYDATTGKVLALEFINRGQEGMTPEQMAEQGLNGANVEQYMFEDAEDGDGKAIDKSGGEIFEALLFNNSTKTFDVDQVVKDKIVADRAARNQLRNMTEAEFDAMNPAQQNKLLFKAMNRNQG